MSAMVTSDAKPTILVTGGAGFIGTHTCLELLAAGFKVLVLDNMDNASPRALERVRELSKCDVEDLILAEVDLLDLAKTEEVFKTKGPFVACVHFAGLKAVGESVQLPLIYYANNIMITLNLLHFCQKYKCFNFVFSSSATVYGDPDFVPITEDHPLRSTNPYGKTKLHIEEILRDLSASQPGVWSIAILRYFNPIGAHPSGRIGEDPKGIPNNLVPFIAQVAVGRRAELGVFGNDYDTVDGTGVRDYLHVVDLAQAHVAATKKVLAKGALGAQAYNLGSGKGTSVLEMVAAFEKASGKEIKVAIKPRRVGDIATCFAEPSKALKELGWTAKLTVEQACEDGWRWQSTNPNGFLEEGDKEDTSGKRKGLIFDMYK